MEHAARAPLGSTLAQTFRYVGGTIGGAWAGATAAAATGQVEMAPAWVYGGAVAGAAAVGALSQTKMKNTRAIGVGGVLKRSTMKIKGKKGKLKHKKTVKVSKYLKAAIKQVNEGSSAAGMYTRIHTGMVGSLEGAALPFSITAGAGSGLVSGQLIAIGPPNIQNAGAKSLFNNSLLYSVGAASVYQNGSDFNYFTPAKILHAASVMFNQKAENIDPTNTTGNLSTVFNPATGGPDVTSVQQLKINVKKSWVKFSIKNTSDRIVLMDIWECTPKLKFQVLNPLASMGPTVATVLDTATKNGEVKFFNNGSTTTQAVSYLDGNWDPFTDLQKRGFNFKNMHREMILQPDETCVHWIKGPSGVLDFAKLEDDGVTQINSLLKNWSVSCVVGIRGDQIKRTTGNSLGERLAFSDNITSGEMGMPVAIETIETFIMQVPEIAGFVTAAGAAGTTQMLNLRKNKRVISNWVNTNGTVTTQMDVSNEETPMSAATSGQNV